MPKPKPTREPRTPHPPHFGAAAGAGVARDQSAPGNAPQRSRDREAVAVSIDRFLAVVSSWISWFTLIQFEERHFIEPARADTPPAVRALLEPFVATRAPEIEAAERAQARHAAGRRIFEHTEKQNDEMVKVRDEGRALAADLELLGIDPTPVLTIVHCTERHGGGPAYVLPRWEEWKVALRRSALLLRVHGGASPTASRSAAAMSRQTSPAAGTRRPRKHEANFRFQVAGDRARGDSWQTIADRYEVTRQATRHWAKWDEVRKAESVRSKGRSSIRRPERLGGRDVEDEGSDADE